jgi:hypothetical protein
VFADIRSDPETEVSQARLRALLLFLGGLVLKEHVALQMRTVQVKKGVGKICISPANSYFS